MHKAGPAQHQGRTSQLQGRTAYVQGENALHGVDQGQFCTHVHDWTPATSERRIYSEAATEHGPHSVVGSKLHDGQMSRANTSPGSACGCGAWLGALGLEPTPELYVQHLVEVFRAVRRVLRPDGTLWLNLGDSYAGGGPSGASYQSRTTKARAGKDRDGNFRLSKSLGDRGLTYAQKKPIPPRGLKSKDLIGIPWMVAFALRADGWYLRRDIIWDKPNPMPESVTDRPTSSHEYVFLLTQSERYYYDADAIREPSSYQDDNANGRNKLSVWRIASESYPGAHFAVMPMALAKPCIQAGTSEHGCCSVCRAPWKRIVTEAVTEPDLSQRSTSHYDTAERYGAGNGGNGGFDKLAARMREGTHGSVTVGWQATCVHRDAPVRPCLVLDPFAGSGTTGLVAQGLRRDSVLIDASLDYVPLIEERLRGLPVRRPRSVPVDPRQASLFDYSAS